MAKRYGGHTYSLAKKETLTLTRTHVPLVGIDCIDSLAGSCSVQIIGGSECSFTQTYPHSKL